MARLHCCHRHWHSNSPPSLSTVCPTSPLTGPSSALACFLDTNFVSIARLHCCYLHWHSNSLPSLSTVRPTSPLTGPSCELLCFRDTNSVVFIVWLMLLTLACPHIGISVGVLKGFSHVHPTRPISTVPYRYRYGTFLRILLKQNNVLKLSIHVVVCRKCLFFKLPSLFASLFFIEFRAVQFVYVFICCDRFGRGRRSSAWPSHCLSSLSS